MKDFGWLVDLRARRVSCKFFGGRKVKEITFFGWKLRGLQIIFWVRNFEVSVWPRSLRAAFDCTAVFLCNSVLIILVFAQKFTKWFRFKLGKQSSISSPLHLSCSHRPPPARKSVSGNISSKWDRLWHLDYIIGLDILESSNIYCSNLFLNFLFLLFLVLDCKKKKVLDNIYWNT